MLNRYYIIDNFYDNPDIVRQMAIDTEKEENSSGNYPGVMTDISLFSEDHRQMFSELTNEPVQAGTQLNGKFRFAKESDTFKQHIHFDFGDGLIWAGVLYLSKPEDCDKIDSGTSFWKHKETRLEEIPRTLEGIQKYGWNGIPDLKNFLDTDGVDESKWEKTFTVPAKYNRLVLFRPWLFHSSSKHGFGDSLENCRLIQTFFLRNKLNNENSGIHDSQERS